jgi:hypothetical protein
MHGGGEEEDAAAAALRGMNTDIPASALMGIREDLSASDALLGLRSVGRNAVARPSSPRQRNAEKMRIRRAVERAASTPEEIEAQLAQRREYQRQLAQRKREGTFQPKMRVEYVPKTVKRGGSMSHIVAYINGQLRLSPQLASEIATLLRMHSFMVKPDFYPSPREERDVKSILATIIKQSEDSMIHPRTSTYNMQSPYPYYPPVNWHGSTTGDGRKEKFARKYLKGMGVTATKKNVSEVMSAMDAEGVVF